MLPFNHWMLALDCVYLNLHSALHQVIENLMVSVCVLLLWYMKYFLVVWFVPCSLVELALAFLIAVF